ncbi:hypothetical protein [Prevotella intermedia]|uniref:hypothetical protein n=1 Tax=Prevotella intermedia TaxID=28131 RepID=UPI00117E01D9|nr:hypothetical protein [Prevotella intermedia]
MSSKNRKKHDLEDLQKYMYLLDDGHSFESIHTTYGINTEYLKVLHSRYLQQGPGGLQKGKNIKTDFALNKQIVLEIEKKHLTLHAASLKVWSSSSNHK